MAPTSLRSSETRWVAGGLSRLLRGGMGDRLSERSGAAAVLVDEIDKLRDASAAAIRPELAPYLVPCCAECFPCAAPVCRPFGLCSRRTRAALLRKMAFDSEAVCSDTAKAMSSDGPAQSDDFGASSAARRSA